MMQLEILKFIQSFGSPFLDWLFQLITASAEEGAVIAIAAVVLWCYRKDMGYKLGFVCLSGNALNIGLKDTFRTPRPIGQEGIKSIRLETAPGYSFPSGHTQNATAFWSTIALGMKSKLLWGFAILMFCLVGLSRMYLGVHWPIDVAGGILLGLIWAFLINKLYDYAFKANRKYLLSLPLLLMALGLAFFPDADYIKDLGAMAGFYMGFVIEQRFIGYDTRAFLPVQLMKLVLGLTVLAALKSGLKLVLPVSLWSDFLRYAVIGLWVSAGAPAAFCLIFGKGKGRR